MSREQNPSVGSPEQHWGTSHPEDQPCRDEVLGLRRLVIETRSRLGGEASPEAIAADLQGRGITVDPAEIARCCAEPY